MQARRAVVAFFGVALFLSCLSHPVSAIARYMQLVAPGQGWTVNTQGLWWTDDDGIHWKNISPPEAKYFNDVFFIDASHGWALYATDGKKEGTLDFRVVSTSDGGSSWVSSLVKVEPQAPGQFDGTAWLDFSDSRHGWLVIRQATSVAFSIGWMFATGDGGETWTELPTPPIAARPVFASATDGWLAGGAGGDELYVTRDGGKTWSWAGIPAPASIKGADHPAYGPLVFSDSRHGNLVVTFSPTIFTEGPQSSALVLFATDDGGRSWKTDIVLADLRETSVGANIPSAAVADSVLIVKRVSRLPHLQLMKVAPNGQVTRVEAPAEWDTIVNEMGFASPTQGWILTSNGRLLSTRDGGTTWKWLRPEEPPRDLPEPPRAPSLTPLKKIGPGPELPPPGRPPQLEQKPAAEPPQVPQSLYVAPHIGFDQHQVTNTANMANWFNYSPFFDVGVYAGGINYCYRSGSTCLRSDPNLTGSWVSTVEAQGRGIMPIWVGPQAPCVDAKAGTYTLFTAANAASMGSSNADSAAAAMKTLGLSGTVVFYDMENYSAAVGSACSQAVQTFLTNWVSKMNVDGFQTTGVYGNPLPAELDFSKVPGLTEAWVAWPAVQENGTKPGGAPLITIWGLSSLTDSCCFTNNQRAHQFLIGVKSVSYGGAKFSQIDYDMVDLQIPGGSGHKGYDVPTPSTITYVASLYDWAGGVNDVWLDNIGTPDFIIQGQTGQIVGTYSTSSDVSNGFIDNNGNITYLSNTEWPNGQTNEGLNNTGSFVGATGGDGFLGNISSNTYTVVDGPLGAVAGVFLNSIDDDAQAVGSYYVSNGTENVPLGFIYQNSTATNVDPGCPDESDDGSGGATFIYGINGYGQMVGHYASADGTQAHGFLYSNGTCTTIDIPGAYTGSTWPYGINNNGQIVGSYSNGTTILGFMLDGAVYYSFSYPPPQGDTTFETVPNSINDAAQIVGYAYGGGVVWYNAFEVGLVPAQ